MPDRMLVVSATNLLARGFLVVPTDRRSRRGDPVNGLFAVARAIERAIAFKTPAHAVAVIEAAAPPTAWPALLRAQLAPLPGLLTALGLPIVEASDEVHAVASYARAAVDAGHDVVVVGIDKRFAQLVTDRVWWYDANKDARYTPEMVHKRFLVPPAQVGEWLALVGDDDVLPGVAGIGAKGATSLLETYGSIDRALAAVGSIAGRTGNALRAAIDAVPRELARARLDTGRALPVPLDALAFTRSPPRSRNELYDQLGFVELLAPDGATTTRVVICDTVDDAAAALTGMGAGPVAIHAVLDEPADALVGLALSTGAGEATYVPFSGAGRSVEPRALARWLEDDRVAKVGHDLVALIVALHRHGIRLAGIVGDTACASHLTEPSNWAPHDLPLVAKHVLGRALPDEDAVRGIGRQRKPWASLAVDRAAELAGGRADAVAAIWRALSPRIDPPGAPEEPPARSARIDLEGAPEEPPARSARIDSEGAPEEPPARSARIDPALLAEYLELSDTLVRMELTGLVVDTGELARAEHDFEAIEADLEQAIAAHAGRAFNINSSKQLGAVLFEDLGLPIVSHTKTGWSTAIEALERIEHAHPIVPLVIRWRLLRRLRDSWITALGACIGDDGRVHSRFHPARSFSGRLVNTNPDLGRVPGRSPEMRRIRRAFIAGPGRVLLSVDYNQLGLHVLAHLTKDPALVEPLRQRDDLHTLTAMAVLERPRDAITPDDRQLGKVVNFATFAGQGASALALQLGVTAQQAKDLIDRFDRRYAGVRAFQDEQLRLVRDRGFVETLAGRRWPIGGLGSLDPHDRSYAERLARRAPHEGSVADVARRGLLEADRALRRDRLAAAPVLQILDEVLFEVPTAELADAARVAGAAMRHAFALEVPLRVGVKAGPTWADLEPLSVDE